MKAKLLCTAVFVFIILAPIALRAELVDVTYLFCTSQAERYFEQGIQFYEGSGVPQDYKEAIECFTKGAEEGNVRAQFYLGVMYANGEGVPQNYEEAIKWFTKAAEQGSATAQSNLGVIYENGRGVPRDYKEAIKWFTKATEQGDANAQFHLGQMYLYGRGVPHDYKEAVKWYTKAAEQGDADTQSILNIEYYLGHRVPQDYKEAIKWFTKAAEQGDAFAQWNLGKMYCYGQGVPKDYKEAVKWYTKAAEQGYANAQFNLGQMFNAGKGVPQDYKAGIEWFTKAAEQGYAEAKAALGVLYYNGQGVPQDYREAVKWYTKAAEQGDANAQFLLGWMYYHGQGVPQDYVQAYKWLNLSAAQGNDSANNARKILVGGMTTAQIAEAQRLSRQFSPKTGKHTPSDAREPASTEIKGSGTGFFITADGYILTAYHVVKETESLQVWIDGRLRPARLARVDVANDIALLKVDGITAVALPIRSSRDVITGLDIFTLGFPNIQLQGTEVKYTRGNISSLTGLGDDPRLFQVSVPIQPGNSGGPLLDEDGQVIGLVIAKLDEIITAQATGSLPQNVNYALKSSFVLSFLESLPELSDKLVRTRNKGLSRTQVVKQSSDAVVMVLCY